jgi:predicted alpha/beta hydrolase
MLEATEWFAQNELANVRALCDKHPGYGLVLVGHSLGAGTACLLAHWIKNVPEARLVVFVDSRGVAKAACRALLL